MLSATFSFQIKEAALYQLLRITELPPSVRTEVHQVCPCVGSSVCAQVRVGVKDKGGGNICEQKLRVLQRIMATCAWMCGKKPAWSLGEFFVLLAHACVSFPQAHRNRHSCSRAPGEQWEWNSCSLSGSAHAPSLCTVISALVYGQM